MDLNVYLIKICYEESSLKWGEWGEWWWSDEIEGRWLEEVFKVDADLVGEINTGGRYSLGWLLDLEEEWFDGWWMLIADIRIEELSFNAGSNWEHDKEMCSCEFLISSSII